MWDQQRCNIRCWRLAILTRIENKQTQPYTSCNINRFVSKCYKMAKSTAGWMIWLKLLRISLFFTYMWCVTFVVRGDMALEQVWCMALSTQIIIIWYINGIHINFISWQVKINSKRCFQSLLISAVFFNVRFNKIIKKNFNQRLLVR